MTAADPDVAALERVLHRLAITEEDALGGVLAVLLPRLLSMALPGQAPATRTTLLGVLSHLTKRVRERPVPLPFDALLALLRTPVPPAPAPSSQLVRVFASIAFARLDAAGKDAALPALLCLSAYPAEGGVRDWVAGLVLRALPHAHVPPDAATRASKFGAFLASSEDVSAITTLFSDALMYLPPPPPAPPAGAAAGSAIAAALAGTLLRGAAAPAATAPPVVAVVSPPPGLSLRGFQRVTSADSLDPAALSAAASALSSSDLLTIKRAVLRFSSSSGILPEDALLPVALAGLAEPHSDICSVAEDMLRRLAGSEVESEALVRLLFQTMLGSAGEGSGGGAAAAAATPAAAAPHPDARSRAPLAVRLRALTLLTRSRRATASSLPTAVKACFEAWFGQHTMGGGGGGASGALRYQQAGVRFASAVLALAEPHALAPFGPLFLTGLTKLLSQASAAPTTVAAGTDAPPSPGGSGGSLASVLGTRDAIERDRVRELVYGAFAGLARRAPRALVSSTAAARLLFSRLESEAPDMRLSVAEALAALAGVYTVRRVVLPDTMTGTPPPIIDAAAPFLHAATPPAVLEELLTAILEPAARSTESRARLAAADWTARVFAFSDVRARVLCCSLVGDPRPEVREVARAGLRPYGRTGARLGGEGDITSGDRDRGDLSGITRRSDPSRLLGEGGGGAAGAGGAAAADAAADEEGGATLDVIADSSSFSRLVQAYPLFNSLVRYTTMLGEDEEAALLHATAAVEREGREKGKWSVDGPQGGEGGEGEHAHKRMRGEGVIGNTSSGSPGGIVFVDMPDGDALPLGRTVTSLSALGLAALLEFTNTSLDATAARAGHSTSSYITWLDSGGSGEEVTLLHAWRSLIEHALARSPAEADASRLHATAVSCLAQLMAAAPSRLCTLYARRLAWLTRWLRDTSPTVRASMAAVLGVAATALPLDAADTAAAVTAGSGASSAVTVADVIVDLQRSAASSAVQTADFSHGSLMALGQVLAHAVPRMQRRAAGTAAPASPPPASDTTLMATQPQLDVALVQSALSTLLTQIRSSKYDSVKDAALVALAALSRTGSLPLPPGDTKTAITIADVLRRDGLVAALELSKGIEGLPDSSSTSRADVVILLIRVATGLDKAAASLAGVATAVAMEEDQKGVDNDNASGDAPSAAKRGAIALTEAAAVTLGAIVSGELLSVMVSSPSSPGGGMDVEASSGSVIGAGTIPPIAAAALAGLYCLSTSRHEQVALTVGAALAEAACGVPATRPTDVTSVSGVISDSSSGSLAVFADASGGADGGTAPHAPAPIRQTTREREMRAAVCAAVLDHALSSSGPLHSIKSAERVSSTLWVLTLLHALAAGGAKGEDNSVMDVSTRPLGWEALSQRLPALQVTLTRLLGEKSPIAQEAAAKALSLLYDVADVDGRRSLTAALVDSLSTGRKAPPVTIAPAAPAALEGDAAAGAVAASATTAPADAALSSGPAAMSLAASGDASYRELCAMASGLGQPDLVYRFLALAGHHAAWHTRGGASLGLEALLRGRARAEVAPYLDALLPRLFRHQYDPVPRVRESMRRLWGALVVGDARRAVDAHINVILSDLVTASESPQWREREAACAALSDVLPGRSYAEVRTHLGNLWRAVLRAIDDVKDSVREAGMDALKALSKLTLRLTDPLLTSKADGAAAVAVVLPFLLRDGLAHPIKEAAAACLLHLRAVVKVAGRLLMPYLAELVSAALTSASALEPEALSYLQTHADGGSSMHGDISGDRLETARIAATRASPLASALDTAISLLATTPRHELDGTAPPLPHVLDGPAATVVAAGRSSVGVPPTIAASAGAGAAAAAASPTPPTPILAPLVDVLRDLIRKGVGLPTRGATARFIVALTGAVTDALTPVHAAALVRTLSGSLEGEPSPTLRREFATAAAHVARYASPASGAVLITRLVALAQHGDASLRETAAVGMLALVRFAGERTREGAATLVPIAFLGASGDPSEATRDAWSEAWDALAPSQGQVVRLNLLEITAAVCTSLRSSAWVLKRQGAAGITRLVDLLNVRGGEGVGTPSSVLSPSGCGPLSHMPPPSSRTWRSESDVMMTTVAAPHPAPPVTVTVELRPYAGDIAGALSDAISSGRAWEGKDELLTALALLLTHCAPAFDEAAGWEVASSDGGGGGGGDTMMQQEEVEEKGGGGVGGVAASARSAELASEAEEAMGSGVAPPMATLAPPPPPSLPPIASLQPRELTPLGPLVHILIRQAARGGGVPRAYTQAALDGLALVLSSYPTASPRAFAEVALAVSPTLRRLHAASRPTQTSAVVVTSGGASMLGGRFDETKDGEARAAAREDAAADALLFASALGALAAALPGEECGVSSGSLSPSLGGAIALASLEALEGVDGSLPQRVRLMRAAAHGGSRVGAHALMAAYPVGEKGDAGTHLLTLLSGGGGMVVSSEVGGTCDPLASILLKSWAGAVSATSSRGIARSASLEGMTALSQHLLHTCPAASKAWADCNLATGVHTAIAAVQPWSTASGNDPHVGEAARKCAAALAELSARVSAAAAAV